MKRSAFMTAIVVLGLATTAVTVMAQPAGAAGTPPGYAGRPGMMGNPGGPGIDQQQKIATIHEDTRQKNWDAMGQLLSERFRLSSLYRADKLDANAIIEQQRKVDELRRVLLRSHIEMEIQIDALLTKDQRELLRSTTPWHMH